LVGCDAFDHRVSFPYKKQADLSKAVFPTSHHEAKNGKKKPFIFNVL
jgi:hypothetical protein